MFNKTWIIYILLAIRSVLLGFVSYTTKEAISSLDTKDFSSFLIWSSIDLVTFPLMIFVWIICHNLILKHASKKIIKLKEKQNRKLFYNYSYFNGVNSGKYVNEILDTPEIFKENIFVNHFLIIENVINIIALSIVSIIFSWILFIIIFLAVILNELIYKIVEKVVTKIQNKEIEEKSEYNSKVWNLVQNIANFLFYNKFLIIKYIFKNEIEIHNKKINILSNKSTALSSFITFVSISMQILLILSAGILLINNLVDIGIVVATASLSAFIFDSFGSLVWNIITKKSSSNNLKKWNDKIEEYDNKDLAIESIQILNLNSSFFKKVINLNLKFEKGKKYLIIGNSGSGKSSLINFILGVSQEYQGKILINNKCDQLYRYTHNFVLINSNDPILKGNLAENITIFDNQIEEDKFVLAIEKSKIDFSDTKNLSTGEKQRINLARIFYFNKNWIILDESLSNIDKKNATIIEKNILDLKDKTIIHISHSLNKQNLKYYDQIINFNK